MKTKRIMSILIVLCFLIISSSNARADMSDINEDEQRVIDAAIAGYVFDGKTYVATESGVAALQRKMRTVDLDKKDADSLIKSRLTKYDIEEQLQKGYIVLASGSSSEEPSQGSSNLPYSPTDPPDTPDPSRNTTGSNSTTPSTTGSDPTTPSTTESNLSTPSTTGSGSGTPSSSGPNSNVSQSTGGSQTGNNATGSQNAGSSDSGKTNNGNLEQQNKSNSDNSSNTTLPDGAKVASASRAKKSTSETTSYSSSQSKASSIWNAIISDTSKEEDSSDSKKDSKSSDKSSEDSKSSDKSSGDSKSSDKSSKESDADSTTSLVEETLDAIDSENKQGKELSYYKMRSEDDADMKILCNTDSDEVAILNKNGDLVLSFTDSDVKSEGIEGNVIHIEWLIPLWFVLLFISVVLGYIVFRQSDYVKEQSRINLSQRVRTLLSIVGGMILAACILICVVVGGLFSGLLRSSTVMQAINNSSYYEYAYAGMAENTVRILDENNIDALALAEILDYDDFTLVVKQQIEKQLSTPEDEFSVEKTQNNVSKKLDEYYKDAEEKKIEESGVEETKDEKKERSIERKSKVNAITNSIMTNYKKYADFYPAHFIRQVKRDLRAVFQVVLPVALLTAIINIFTLYYLNQKRYKGMNYIGGSMALSALIALSVSGIVFKTKPYTNFYLSPKYLYQFILSYLDKATETFFIISVLLAILAVIILVLNRIIFMKKR